MYIANYPEDSTLRRHRDAAAAFAREQFLAQPPTDSILRRHYDQQHSTQASPAAAAASPTATAAVTGERSAPTPPPAAASRPAPASQTYATKDSGGFIAWLRRWFG